MIQVLKESSQVHTSIQQLSRMALPLHVTAQKNWDHKLLVDLLEGVSKETKILDLGSGDGFTLTLLHHLGYKQIFGIDYAKPRRSRRETLRRIFRPFKFDPANLITIGDICRTHFPEESFEWMTCISVIEHGVDLAVFFEEVARLLAPGGRLLITFDYWHDFDSSQTQEIQIFDLPWKIFNENSVRKMINLASEYCLEIADSSLCMTKAAREAKGSVSSGELKTVRDNHQMTAIPSCQQATVSYSGFEYTFMAIVFEKHS
ncbi:class I SAM-dependent methyltransferase [Poriferisphaera sp. WC338]|uniref:class I SAM-dependent methyltransferase n=1 Tax=Poriferisphaera sp. WC338 TaxID=3425129 RepID=UPI003D816AC2